MIGALGLGYVTAGVGIWLRVVTSPGDDNPVALVGIVAAMLGLVPGRGVVLWLRRRPLRAHRVWLALALVALTALAALTPVLCLLLFGR